MRSRRLALNLDSDLVEELNTTVASRGLVWRSLPATLQLRLIEKYLAKQVAREAAIMNEACSVAAAC